MTSPILPVLFTSASIFEQSGIFIPSDFFLSLSIATPSFLLRLLPLIANKKGNTLKFTVTQRVANVHPLYFCLDSFSFEIYIYFFFFKSFYSFLIFSWSGNQSEHHRVSVILAEKHKIKQTKATKTQEREGC